MKKWVIAFMLLGFSMTFMGCYGEGGDCPHGVCTKQYYEKYGSGSEDSGE